MWLQHDFTTPVIFAFIRKCPSAAPKHILNHSLSGCYLIAICPVKMNALTLAIFWIYFQLHKSWWWFLYCWDDLWEACSWARILANYHLAWNTFIEAYSALHSESNQTCSITGNSILGKLLTFVINHSKRITWHPAIQHPVGLCKDQRWCVNHLAQCLAHSQLWINVGIHHLLLALKTCVVYIAIFSASCWEIILEI